MPAVTTGSADDGLVLRSHWGPGGIDPMLEVLHAAPEALFSGQLLRLVQRGEAQPFTELDRAEIGGVLKIYAEDRTLIYRLTAYDAKRDVYTGHWPD